jgi:hypothetical protein
MRRICGPCSHVIVLGIVLLFSVSAAQSAVTIQDVHPTDVTPSGFSVLWQTSEPAVPGISIFSDAAGADDITTQLEIISFAVLSRSERASCRERV